MILNRTSILKRRPQYNNIIHSYATPYINTARRGRAEVARPSCLPKQARAPARTPISISLWRPITGDKHTSEYPRRPQPRWLRSSRSLICPPHQLFTRTHRHACLITEPKCMIVESIQAAAATGLLITYQYSVTVWSGARLAVTRRTI